MKKLSLLILLAFLPSLLMAQMPEEKRRIEEEKRQSLIPTEERVLKSPKIYPEAASSIDMDYFRNLLSRRVAYLSDAFKTIVILLGVKDQYKDFKSQFRFLKEKGIISDKAISEPNPNEPLRKGLAAYMYCKALGIKGGLWLRTFGISQRYALRELVFEGIMLHGYSNDIVSGKELVLILTNAANYMAKNIK